MSKLTGHLNIVITPELREQLEAEATRRGLKISEASRQLLQEILDLYNTAGFPAPSSSRYEIFLTPAEAANLTELGIPLQRPL